MRNTRRWIPRLVLTLMLLASSQAAVYADEAAAATNSQTPDAMDSSTQSTPAAPEAIFTGPSTFTTYYVQPSAAAFVAPTATAPASAEAPAATDRASVAPGVAAASTVLAPSPSVATVAPTGDWRSEPSQAPAPFMIAGRPGGVHLWQTPAQTFGAAVIPGNLTYNGGPVERTGSKSFGIFWQPSGSFMSANYRPLITRYFSDVGGSGLYDVATQYFDTTGNIVNSSSLGGSFTDSRAYPSSVLSDANIHEEVLNSINANGWDPRGNANFFVYIASGEGSCVGTVCFGPGGFCGYHSSFQATNDGVTFVDVHYALIGYMGGGAILGCGPGGPFPNNDGDADTAINVTSHEQLETVTDPLVGVNSAWLDASGNEMADKCAGTFGARNSAGADTLLNGHPYLVQEEWSNAIGGCTTGLTCFTQPQISVATAPAGAGRLQVTISGTEAGNHVSSIQFGNPASNPAVPTNALIDVGSLSGQSGPFTFTPPSGSTSVTFFVRRQVSGGATTVPLMVSDMCGSWPTLVGGGAAAF